MGGTGSGRPRAPKLPCGTNAAYAQHKKRNEKCKPCLDAHNEYNRSRHKPKIKSRATRLNGRIAVVEEKLRRGQCMDCGLVVTRENYVCFDFDHRNPAKKLFAISTKNRDVAMDLLHAEFAKCDLVCSNCHRLRTHKQMKAGVLTGRTATHIKLDTPPTLFDLTG